MKRVWTLGLSALLWLGLAATAAAAGLSDADRAAVDKAEDYLNSVTTLKARLMQTAPDGTSSEGTLYLKRPGHLRLEYDPPNQTLVRASADWILYSDRSDPLQRAYASVDESLAGILVKPHIALNQDSLTVTQVTHQPGIVRITVTNRAAPTQGRITLVFTESPYALRQWQITDAQNQVTDVSLFDPHGDIALDDSLFTFPVPGDHGMHGGH